MCALVDIEYTSPSSEFTTPTISLLVNSNLCNASIVGNTTLPMLRRLPWWQGFHYETFPDLQYHLLKTHSFDTVHLYINTDADTKASFLQGTLKATLHFQQAA